MIRFQAVCVGMALEAVTLLALLPTALSETGTGSINAVAMARAVTVSIDGDRFMSTSRRIGLCVAVALPPHVAHPWSP